MSNSRRSRWQPRGYFYQLLNQADDIESAAIDAAQKTLDLRERYSINFDIALVAETQAKAQQLLGMLKQSSAALLAKANCFNRHRFTAHGLDQPWPERHFDEIHWLSSSSEEPPPSDFLSDMADVIHVHHLAPCKPLPCSGCRTYLWHTEQALAEFWTSLYLAREMPSIPGLDWDSYSSWQPAELCIGQAVTSRGPTPSAATAALLAQVKHARLSTAAEAILVIEGSYDLSIGDYVDILRTLESEVGCDVIPTGWTAPTYSGCGLRLLTFCPPQYSA